MGEPSEDQAGVEGVAAATVRDVARWYDVSERTVRRWVAETDIPHRRIGGTLRFNRAEVDAWSQGGRAA